MGLITGETFVPEIGKCYEVHFGKIIVHGRNGYVAASIKVKGLHPSEWIDLATGNVLDPEISKYIPQAFKEIACV